MKALKFLKPNKYEYIETEIPKIDTDMMLIKVMAAGICRSDVVAFRGKHSKRVPPVITGHEFSGVIKSIGERAAGEFNVGDRVVIEPHIGCGSCFYCKSGRYNLCPNKRFIGVGNWVGCFAEYVSVYPSMCFSMPDELSFEEGALMEPFCVGNHAVELAQLLFDSSVAILGCGTIGMMTIKSLVSHGLKEIFGTDVSEVKLEFALAQGATRTFNPTKEDIVPLLLNVTNSIGVDAVFITSPFPELINQAVRICKKGGKIIIIAAFEDPILFHFIKIPHGEFNVIGSHMYTKKDYAYALEEYKKGNLNLLPLITKKISFKQAGKFIKELAMGKHSDEIKIIIDYNYDL